MSTRELSNREAQIVKLCVDGLTNDAIAHVLGLSIGTVNTYWLRIKLKVGGYGRTDSVVRVMQQRADRELEVANSDRQNLTDLIAEHERSAVELRAALALLQVAIDEIKSAVWATDRQLIIRILASGEFPERHLRQSWEVGKSVWDLFHTKDPREAAIECHLAALTGTVAERQLSGNFEGMALRVNPHTDEQGEVMGCLSILRAQPTPGPSLI